MLLDPQPIPSLDGISRLHFIAIGGSGMSAIARLYLERGSRVSGSDQADSAELQSLATLGAKVWVGHDATRLGPVDGVVVSSAIKADNVELVAAQTRGIPVWHRSLALAALMTGRRGIAVAGTHGKTTTSGMLVTVLAATGRDPSYVIGSPLAATGVAAGWGSGPDFVVEADESDGSFRQYPTAIAVITALEADHLDNWETVEAYREGFHQFAAADQVEWVVACGDDPAAAQLAGRLRAEGRRAITYGTAVDCDVRLTELNLAGMTPGCRLVWPRTLLDQPAPATAALSTATPASDPLVIDLRLSVPGRHNLLNATAALVAAVLAGADPFQAAVCLAGFRGTARRFELVGQSAGITVVDDYAHHPSEVAATLAAARSVSSGRLVAVFQPHLYSRTRDFAADFATALATADLVVVTDVYPARELPIPGVSGQLIVDAMPDAARSRVSYLADYQRLPAHLGPLLLPGDLVLTLGAGSITTIGHKLLAWLEGGR